MIPKTTIGADFLGAICYSAGLRVNGKADQKVVNLAIKEALKQKCKSPQELERLMKEKGVECKFTLEEGRLKYSSYSYQGVLIKGQDVGFTAQQLQIRLDKHLEVKKGRELGIVLGL